MTKLENKQQQSNRILTLTIIGINNHMLTDTTDEQSLIFS